MKRLVLILIPLILGAGTVSAWSGPPPPPSPVAGLGAPLPMSSDERTEKDPKHLPGKQATRPDCDTDQVSSRVGGWTSIRSPSFPDGETQTLVGFAASPLDPRLLFATNGSSILKSSDRGCTWIVSFRASSALPAASQVAAPITALVAAVDGRGRLTLWAPKNIGFEGDATAGVLVSHDAGRSWDLSNEGLGLVTNFGRLSVGPDGTAYILAATGPITRVFASDDGGRSWQKRYEETPLTDAPILNTSVPLAADPKVASTLWLGGEALSRSVDGGRTWQPVDLGATGTVLDIRAHAPAGGAPTSLVLLHEGPRGLTTSIDGGRSWKREVDAPGFLTSVVYRNDGSLVAVSRSDNGDAVFQSDGHSWTLIADPRPPDSLTLVASDRVAPGHIYGTSVRGSLRWIETHVVPRTEVKDEPEGIGSGGIATLECWDQEPPVPIPGMDSAPIGHDPLYAVNFHKGEVVRFDRWGNGTVVAKIPPYAEGITLDSLDRVIISTRFSNKLVRFDPRLCRADLISGDINTVEAPQFDNDQNLYVVDTEGAGGAAGQVFQFPAPLAPGVLPRRIWTGNTLEFTEDIEIAPETSPYAGDLFVLLNNPSDGTDCTEPDSILRLHKTERGWERHTFIAKFPITDPDLPSSSCQSYAGRGPGFNALGFVFHPDGRLLIPDHGGSGVILEYSPDGTSYDVFGQVEGAPSFAKIDITPDGFVYITASTFTSMPSACSTDGSRIVRFDPEGGRMWPDFSEHLVCPVGVAVPHELIQLPQLPQPDLREQEPRDDPIQHRPQIPRRAIAVAPFVPPLPPPPAPGTAPGPVNAASTAVEPMPAPARAPNPQAAPVAQRQEQPQMAFVHAAQQLKEQLGMQHAMVRSISPRPDPLGAAKFGLAMSALSMILVYGLATVTVKQALARRD